MEHLPDPPPLTLDPNDENIILEVPEDYDPHAQADKTQIKKEKVCYSFCSMLDHLPLLL